MAKIKFIVIWNKTEHIKNDYETAIKLATKLTYNQEEHDTALIIKRRETDFDIIIDGLIGVRWISDHTFEECMLSI